MSTSAPTVGVSRRAYHTTRLPVRAGICHPTAVWKCGRGCIFGKAGTTPPPGNPPLKGNVIGTSGSPTTKALQSPVVDGNLSTYYDGQFAQRNGPGWRCRPPAPSTQISTPRARKLPRGWWAAFSRPATPRTSPRCGESLARSSPRRGQQLKT